MVAELGSPEFANRAAAEKELLAAGPGALKALRAGLKSDDAEVVRQARACISRIEAQQRLLPVMARVAAWKRPVDSLRVVWRLPNESEVRWQATGTVARVGVKAKDAVPFLLENLASPKDDVARDCLSLLHSCLDRDQLPLLLAATKDKRQQVRTGAVVKLVNFPREGKAVVPVLLAALHDHDAAVRFAAAGALGRFASEERVAPALLAALNDRAVPKTCLFGVIGSVATQAAGALGFLGSRGRPVLPVLSRLARAEKEEALRRLAIYSIGRIGGVDGDCAREALPILVDLLRDNDDARVRDMAAHGIELMGSRAANAVPTLLDIFDVKHVKDPVQTKRLRIRILSVLGAIGPGAKQAVPQLVRVVQSETTDREELTEAMQALAKIGPAARDAVPALNRVAEKNKDPYLRYCATLALQAIRR
jgi:HEAT repeat protein